MESTLVAHIVIYIESRQQVEESLERWRFAMERRRMKIRKRQDYMCLNERETGVRVKLQEAVIVKVVDFKYVA